MSSQIKDQKEQKVIGTGLEKLLAEMEKRADATDASVLFLSSVVLIFWLYTRRLVKKELCYKHCDISTVL